MPAGAGEPVPTLRTRDPLDGARFQDLQDHVEEAIAELLGAIREDMTGESSEASFERIAVADRALDGAIGRIEGVIYGSQPPEDGSHAAREEGQALESFYRESQTLDLGRIALIGDVLARRMSGKAVPLSTSYRERFESYLNTLRRTLARVHARESSARYLDIVEVTTRREGDHVTLTALVENPNDLDYPEVAVTLYSGADFDVAGGDSRRIALAAGETRTVTFEIDLTGDTGYGATVTLLPLAEGVKGLPCMLSLE
jgi:hypothetical protein